jgi:transposase
MVKHVEKFHSSYKESMIVIFEAGPLGFAPYRALTKAGYTCRMIAPSSIPRQSKRQKTDRRDAIDNLHHFTSGTLRFVRIPEEKDVEAREWLRYRYELSHRITKQKQRIIGFVKRNGCEYSETKTNWTKTHLKWLRSVTLPIITRQLLDIELDHLEYYEEQLKKMDHILDSLFATDENYKHQAELLQCIAGVGRIGAMTIVLEGGDLSRFRHPNAAMNFFGMIPQTYSSGKSDPAMHITKAGNIYVRLALITAAAVYRDRRLLRTKKTIECMPLPLQEFILRLQERLYTRYHSLRQKGKHSNKAKCAIARELCGFIWELYTKVLPLVADTCLLGKKAA